MPYQEAVQAPPAPPAPLPGRVIVNGKPITSPNEVYSGLVQQRKVLGQQLEQLQEDRSDIARRLSGQGEEHAMDAADRAGLQKRLTSIDSRIEALDAQIAGADAQVASAAAVPGAVVEPPPYR